MISAPIMSRHPPLTPSLLALSLLASALSTLAPTPAHADDASCKVVMDAMMKQIRTAYRETITLEGKPAREFIHTTTAFYYQGKDDHWMKVPMTAQERIDAMHETGATLSNCKQLRQEMVNGQPAIVYAAHEQTTLPVQSIDMQIWIATASGLPLKLESDQEQGGHKVHALTLCTYDNVQPPADVK
jgi:hypothetical protein